MSLIEKIDAEIEELTKLKDGESKSHKLFLDGIISGLKKAMKFVLLEFGTDINVATKTISEQKEPTNFAKITESPETLADFIQRQYGYDQVVEHGNYYNIEYWLGFTEND